MRNEQQHGALDTSDRVPALLTRFIDPVLHDNDIRIVENLSGRFEANLVFRIRWLRPLPRPTQTSR